MTRERQLDLSGLHCPEVVLKVKEALMALPDGAQLMVISTDPLSAIDIPLFARKGGHDCEAKGHLTFSLTKRG